MTTKITSKGQVTLPKEVRKSLGVAAGDHLVCELEGQHCPAAQGRALQRCMARSHPQHARGVE